MSESTGYNGWSNYETWLVALWLDGDQASYAALEAIKAEDGSVHNKVAQVEELVQEMYGFERRGITGDFVNAALRRVDWMEIIEA